jgi:hypothetical protein
MAAVEIFHLNRRRFFTRSSKEASATRSCDDPRPRLANFLYQETSPEGGTVTYTRRYDGSILTKTDALGVKTYAYDGLNRLRSITGGGLPQGFRLLQR